MTTNVVKFAPRAIQQTQKITWGKLKSQLSRLQAAEKEREMQKKRVTDIADMREEIKKFGEIPCA